MGLRALAGITTAQVLIYYVGKIDYPLIIGGKPLFDFTYSIPPTFELAVLFTAITTFFAPGIERFAAPVPSFDELP